jgi:hypothetical protein
MWRFHIEGLPDFQPPSAYWPGGCQIRKALYMETSPIQNPLFSGSEAIFGWFWRSGCYGSCMSTNCTYTPCLWWSSSISGMHHLVHLFKYLCLWLSGCFLFQGQAGMKKKLTFRSSLLQLEWALPDSHFFSCQCLWMPVDIITDSSPCFLICTELEDRVV